MDCSTSNISLWERKLENPRQDDEYEPDYFDVEEMTEEEENEYIRRREAKTRAILKGVFSC